jgi:hypothetical protein
MEDKLMQDDRLAWLRETLDQIYETAQKKNSDYAMGEDWKGNFTRYGLFGMMARMHDKVQRAENLLLLGKPAKVQEAVEDTLLDLATYALLIQQAYQEGLSVFGDLTSPLPPPPSTGQ